MANAFLKNFTLRYYTILSRSSETVSGP